MNLVDAVFRASEENLNKGDWESYETYIYYKALSKEHKAIINEFFSTLFFYDVNDLLDWCGGKIDKPFTKQIGIYWSIEDIKEVRPDLTDEQAGEVLDLLRKHHDATVGINWDTIEVCADIAFPKIPNDSSKG